MRGRMTVLNRVGNIRVGDMAEHELVRALKVLYSSRTTLNLVDPCGIRSMCYHHYPRLIGGCHIPFQPLLILNCVPPFGVRFQAYHH